MTKKIDSHIGQAITLGLSSKASAVYIALLEARAPITPKKLILITKLHRQYVYDALHELQRLGLSRTVGDGRTVQYTANSPAKVLTQMEEKRLKTLESVQGLLELYNRSPVGMVEILEGAEAVIAGEMRITREQESNGWLDIVGGSGSRFLDLFKDSFEEYEAIRLRKGTKIRFIGSVEDVTYNNNPLVQKRPKYEVRHVPHITDAINICIRPESVTFNIYVPEIMSIRIKNKEAVFSQKALFEILWEVAKP